MPVQLSQLASLVRVRRAQWLHAHLHVPDDPSRNVWAVITNMISPAASADASSKAFTASATDGSEHRASTKAAGFAPYLPDLESGAGEGELGALGGGDAGGDGSGKGAAERGV